jgi:hypothetical protein
MTTSLGELRRIPLSDLWKHEEMDFTPWLAREENIARLSSAVDIELQVTRIEAPVGPFSADILAKDATGSYVVIENQYGKTDHVHLGQLLTYAATLDAKAIIWIAERFTDEHRKAIEWLNEHSSDDLSLYAIEAELWVIDGSRPALRFNVLSEPTEIARQAVAIKAAENASDVQKLQFEFWTRFRQELLDRRVLQTAQAARPQYWFDVSLGRTGFTLSSFASPGEMKIGTRLYLNNKIADAALPLLEADRAAIEAEVGERLVWNPNPDKRDKVIMISRSADLYSKEMWPEYLSWLVERVSKFKAAFAGRVKVLDLSIPARMEQ